MKEIEPTEHIASQVVYGGMKEIELVESQYLEEKILSDNIEETQPLHSTLSEEELEKIKRFEERLSSMLEHSAKNIPFGPLETLTVLAGLHKNTLNELVQRPEMIRV